MSVPSFSKANSAKGAGRTILDVYLTVDVEPDCPPYLWTWRGVEEGMPRLLEVFDRERVPGTFFTTGQTAVQFPAAVEAIVGRGHEIGCHGFSHMSFADFDEARARYEISRTNAILREFAPVTSFRAPYLTLPEKFVPLLAENGIAIDSSRASYKFKQAPNPASAVKRLPASVTSSVLRLPPFIRDRWLGTLKSPVVLFVHPWEFVDLRSARLRLDCRFRTGDAALDSFSTAIDLFRKAGAVFRRVQEFQEL